MAGHDAMLHKIGYMLAASLAALLLLVNAISIFFSTMNAQRQEQRLHSMSTAIGVLNGLRTDVGEARVGVDDFIFTGDATGNSLYQVARVDLNGDLRRLESLPKISAETTGDIGQIQRLTSATLAAFQTVVQLRESGQIQTAMQQLSTGGMRQTLGELQSESVHLAATLESLLSSQSAKANSAELTDNAVLMAAALVDVVAFFVILLLVRRTAALREQNAAAKAQTQEQARLLALEETNRRMSEFLNIASHEIRTPLTALKTSLQLAMRTIQRGGATDSTVAKIAPLVHHAEIATERLEHLAGQLVDSSRIQSGAFEAKPEAIDLGEIVRDSVEELRLLHPNRTITLSAPEGTVIVQADATHVWQVITNYLTNALKYSDEDSPVHARLTVDAQAATVSVEDQGPGIPEAEQERIWHKFYRVPGIEHLSGSSKGFGLGLYICKSIIEQSGGEIGVRSTPGQGSTFWFTLPLALTPAPQTSPQSKSSKTAEQSSDAG